MNTCCVGLAYGFKFCLMFKEHHVSRTKGEPHRRFLRVLTSPSGLSREHSYFHTSAFQTSTMPQFRRPQQSTQKAWEPPCSNSRSPDGPVPEPRVATMSGGLGRLLLEERLLP